MRKWMSLVTTCCLMATLICPTTYAATSEAGQAGQQQVKQEQNESQAGQGQATPAASFNDMSQHWAKSEVLHMKGLELLDGYEDGNFRPNRDISRAEFVTVLDRMFGFTGQGSNQFVDLQVSDWFYEAMMRANGSGIIQGTDSTHLAPTAPITREDAAVMIDRAFQLSSGTEAADRLQQFADYSEVSSYSKKALTYFVNENIMNGYNGKLQPKAPITRAETAKLLSSMLADVVSSPVSYKDKTIEGNLIVRSSDVSLHNVVVKGNLLLAEGISEGDVTLEGVTVTGSVIIKGGGSNSITFKNSKLNQVIIDKNGKPVRVIFTEKSGAAAIIALKKALLELAQNSTIGSLTIGSQAHESVVKTEGTINELIVDANDVVVNDEKVAAGLRTSKQPKPTDPDSSGGQPTNPGNPGNPGTPGEKPVASTTIPDHQWQLVWNDEFNGSTIDSSKWTVMDTGLVYNNELQYYSPNNTSIVKDENRSVLQIEAKKGGYEGKDYSSGKMISMGKGDWTYGKIVVRAKLPVQQGMWPAIWMMPTDEAHYGGWPASGEIDIMELIGGEQNQNESRIYSTLHFDSKKADGSHGHDQGSTVLPEGQTFADEYHDFQVEWLPGVIRFYVDGKLHHEVNDWQSKAEGQPEYYTYPAPFDRPFYLILNLAVGGDWPGSPNSDFESEAMKVDFVRVYSYNDLAQWPDVTGNPPSPVKKREPQADGNQLYNDKFTEAVTTNGVPDSWEFIKNAGGVGAVTVVDDEQKGKAAQVTIENAGTESYSIQLTQMPMFVEKNKTYKIMFDAKASAARTIMSKVTQFQKNWTNYSGEKVFELTTDWQSYEYEFDMRGSTDNNARFEFNLGLNTETVLLANVRLVEVGDAEPLPEQPVERAPLLDGNLIYNGTFDQGKDRLAFWNSSIALEDEAVNAQVRVNNFLKFPIMERQLVVDVTETNGDPKSVVVAQPDLQLEANTTYGLYYEAKADTPRTLDIDLVGESSNTIQIPQGKTVQLGTELKTYSGEIVVGDGAAITAYELQLLFGATTGTAYVDNVRLVKRGAPVAIDSYAHVPATQAWMMQGLKLENSSEGGKHVAYMGEGDLLQYKVEAQQTGDYIVSARLASGEASSNVQFSVKSDSGEAVAQSAINLGSTGGWQTYQTVYFTPVHLEAGRSYYFDFEGADYNTLWIDISQNKVKNGKLAEDLSSWELIPNNLTTSRTEGGELVIEMPGTSTQWWDALLQQGNVELTQGKHYRLEFDASASSAKKLQVVLSQSSGEFAKYLEKEAELTESKQHYSYELVMSEPTDAATMFAFGLGNAAANQGAHTVSISNVRLFEVNPSADQGGQPINVNLIGNGDFSKGTEGWQSYASGDPSQIAINAVNRKLQAVIGSAGANPWDRQVINEGFAIQQGARYTITFKAKAEKNRKLGIGIGWVDVEKNYEWHGYFGQQADLTTEEQVFSFTFDAADAGYANSRISFDMGNLSGENDGQNTITISEVSLVNIGPAN